MSPTQRQLTPDDVAGYVRSALGADASVRAGSPLTGVTVEMPSGGIIDPARPERLLAALPRRFNTPSLIEGLFALVDLHSRD